MANSTLGVTLKTTRTGTGVADTSKELGKLNTTVGGLKGALGMLAGGTALGAVTGALKFAITEAMEAERVMALTESTIKATGGAAGLTAQQVADMAGDLSLMTGVADDVIQSGQNMLLTFKEIKGDTFDRATTAMTDMAVAMNGGSLAGLDLKSTSIQLGKALNDPIKGITALSKVGVSFTEAQKAAIKQMVEMNDTAGAQAIILAELESEFGGAAEAAGDTLAGSIAKLQNATSELAEALGKELIPGLNEAAHAALLLMQWTNSINAAYEEQVTRVEDTATTYDEYVAGVLAAAVAAQKLDQSWVNLHGEAVRNGTANKTLTAGLGLMTEQIYLTRTESSEAARAIGRQSSAEYDAAKAAEAAAGRYQGLVDALGVTASANFTLATAAGEAATTQQANADAAARASEAQAAAQASLDARVTGYYNLGAALKDATSQELAQTQLNQLQTLFENGTISQDEYKAATESLGLAYGIFTPKSLALAGATDQLVKLYASGKITAEELTTATGNLTAAAADGKVDMEELGISVDTNVTPAFSAARDQAEKFSGVLDGIDGRTVTTTVNTNYTSSGSGLDNYRAATGSGYANGADFVVPPGFPNDTFPMRVESGERVQVTPAGQSGPPSGGDIYHVTINAPGATANQLYDMLQANDIRRRTGARS